MNLRTVILVCALAMWSASVRAQGTAPRPPMPSLAPSPVEVFRMLLATNEAGREQWLAGKAPEARRIIEAKLREYTALPAGERDTKLRELQLRWYVQQLMRIKAVDRPQQLTKIPEPDRTVVAQRVGRISILPPPLQQAVLTNPVAIAVVAQNPAPRAYDDPRRQEQIARLTEFVEMRHSERERLMSKLTRTEQEQMEKTLSTFGSLARGDRQDAMQGFRKFAQLSEAERQAFLSTAKRWREMSAADRDFWRRVVSALERAQTAPPMPSSASLSGGNQRLATN